MKTKVTRVSVYKADGNPVFGGFLLEPDDEAGGSFLKITGHDEHNDGSSLSFDWEEWDAIVEAVSKHREEWTWK